MQQKFNKIIASLLCLLLVFEQSGLAQSVSVDISSYLAGLHQAFTSDKFRPLHLRYLSYDNQTNNFKLLLDKGDFFSSGMNMAGVRKLNTSDVAAGTLQVGGLIGDEEGTKEVLKHEARKLMEYFYIGLALPNDTFWVNLRPEEKRGQASFLQEEKDLREKQPVPFFDIIDPLLAQTDIGRIMLETDVQLKKDTARMTSPETPEGRQYWDKLYKKAEELYGTEQVTIPTLTRPWIVPNEIIIRETRESAYIYKATLKVMLEEDYLKSNQKPVTSNQNYEFKDPRLKTLNEYSSQLLRELIIPKLNRAVNSSKRYAALRQVYYSLILASWFKARHSSSLRGARDQKVGSPAFGRQEAIFKLINSRDLTNLTSQEPWSVQTYFQQYQKSFQDGEYNIKEPRRSVFGQSVRSYFSGGEVLSLNDIAEITEAIPKAQPLGNRLPELPYLLPYEVTADGQLKGIEADEGRIQIIKNDLIHFLSRRDISIESIEKDRSLQADLAKLAERIYEAQIKAGGREIPKVDNLEGIVIPGITKDDGIVLGMMGIGGLPTDQTNEALVSIREQLEPGMKISYMYLSGQIVSIEGNIIVINFKDEGIEKLDLLSVAKESYITLPDGRTQSILIGQPWFRIKELKALAELFQSKDPISEEMLHADCIKIISFLTDNEVRVREEAVNTIGILFNSRQKISTSAIIEISKKLLELIKQGQTDTKVASVDVLNRLFGSGSQIPDEIVSEALTELTKLVLIAFDFPMSGSSGIKKFNIIHGTWRNLCYSQFAIPQTTIDKCAADLLNVITNSSDRDKNDVAMLLTTLYRSNREISPLIVKDTAATIVNTLRANKLLANLVQALGALYLSRQDVDIEIIRSSSRELLRTLKSSGPNRNILDALRALFESKYEILPEVVDEISVQLLQFVLHRSRGSSSETVLVGLTYTKPETEIRRSAIAALGALFFNKRTIPRRVIDTVPGLLVDLLHDDDDIARGNTAYALAGYLMAGYDIPHNLVSGCLTGLVELLSLDDMRIRFNAATAIGALSAALEELPESVTSELKKNLGLVAIEFTDGGNSPNLASAFTNGLLTRMNPITFLPLPDRFPQSRNLAPENILKIDSEHSLSDILPTGSRLVLPLGRTLVYETSDGRYIALKFLKENENAGLLLYESEVFDYFNQHYRELGLRSIYPRGYLVSGQRVFQIRNLGTEAETVLGSQVDKGGGSLKIAVTGEYHTVMAYEVSDRKYFIYANNPSNKTVDVDKAIENALWDLFVLARRGIVHTSLIELFHNLFESDREDAGRYLWMVDIIRQMGTRGGAGRLHSWTSAVRYPNVRLSGIADCAEFAHISEIAESGNQRNPFPAAGGLASRLAERFGKTTQMVYLLSYTGEYFLSVALLEGSYLRAKGKLDWNNPVVLAKRMRRFYFTTLTAFTGADENTVNKWLRWINFSLLARQMVFFMADGNIYSQYIYDRNIPQEIFGMESTYPNDPRGLRGWVDIEIDKDSGERLCGWYFELCDPGYLRAFFGRHGLENLIDTGNYAHYFIPENLNHGLLRHPDQFLNDLRAEYPGIFRELISIVHPDLGPVNGPLPLQELITANYLLIGQMLKFMATERIPEGGSSPIGMGGMMWNEVTEGIAEAAVLKVRSNGILSEQEIEALALAIENEAGFITSGDLDRLNNDKFKETLKGLPGRWDKVLKKLQKKKGAESFLQTGGSPAGPEKEIVSLQDDAELAALDAASALIIQAIAKLLELFSKGMSEEELNSEAKKIIGMEGFRADRPEDLDGYFGGIRADDDVQKENLRRLKEIFETAIQNVGRRTSNMDRQEQATASPPVGDTKLLERLAFFKQKLQAKKEEFIAAANEEERLDQQRAIRRIDRLGEIATIILERYPELFDTYLNDLITPLLSRDIHLINLILASTVVNQMDIFEKRISSRVPLPIIIIRHELQKCIAKKPLFEKANKFFYLPGFPIVVEGESLTRADHRRMEEAARFIRDSGWLETMPDSLAAIESIVVSKAKSWLGLRGLTKHPKISLLSRISSLGIAVVIIHEATHQLISAAHRANGTWDRIYKFESHLLALGEKIDTIRHQWLAKQRHRASDLLDELQTYIIGYQFNIQAVERMSLNPVEIFLVIGDLQIDLSLAEKAIALLDQESTKGYLNEDEKVWLEEERAQLQNLSPKITVLWNKTLDLLLASSDPDLRYNGYYMLACVWKKDENTERKEEYYQRFTDRLRKETDSSILTSISRHPETFPNPFIDIAKSVMDELVRSPSAGASSPAETFGGIDFTSLPIVTQAITNLKAGFIRDSPLLLASENWGQSLRTMNLDEELSQIQKLIKAGIEPSPNRIKDYLQASCLQDNSVNDMDKVVQCISDILRQEEETCMPTNAIMRDILVVLEAVNSPKELREIFRG